MSDVPEGYYKHLDPEILKFGSAVGPLGPIAFGEAPAKKKVKTYKATPGSNSYLLLRDGPLCHYCNVRMLSTKKAMQFKAKKMAMTVDHIVPRSLGGGNEKENLVLACLACNSGYGSELNKCGCGFCVAAQKRYGL